MQHAFGHLVVPVMHKHADQSYSKAVHANRDRDCRQEYNDSLPQCTVEQIGGQKTEAAQRIKVTQSAAGFSDRNLSPYRCITVEVNGDLEQSNEQHAQLRRKGCSFKVRGINEVRRWIAKRR
jgi:hypothetical protein